MALYKHIQAIAKEIAKMSKKAQENSESLRLNKVKKEIESSIINLINSLEKNSDVGVEDIILQRLKQKRIELDRIEQSIYEESLKTVIISELQVISFLEDLKKGNLNSIKYKKMLIRVFIEAIYLYEKEIICLFNIGTKQIEIKEKLLSEIKNSDESSFFKVFGAPKEK